MNKILLFITFLLLPTSDINAQPFGANNATWYFTQWNTFFPPQSLNPIKVTSSPPFPFNGYTCRTINLSYLSACTPDTSYIVMESNDSVYYYLPNTNHFVMLYNYNAAVGDTHTIYGEDINGLDTSMQMVVSATGTITINGILKRTYDLSYTVPFGDYFDFQGRVIEDIGHSFFLFPQWGFCDPSIHSLRCYEDSLLGFYQVNQNIACDSIIWLASNDQNGNEIHIFPNPFNTSFYITATGYVSNPISFVVYDAMGKAVWNILEQKNSAYFKKEIDTELWAKGIYLLVLESEGRRYIEKIVKE